MLSILKQFFRNKIVQFFIDEHEKGRTPNPCIECNREIRFTYLLDHALALDAQYLATGHYVRVEAENGRFKIRKGVDDHKDQSYVLHMLSQEKLSHVLFPVGDYTKTQVRELATQFKSSGGLEKRKPRFMLFRRRQLSTLFART